MTSNLSEACAQCEQTEISKMYFANIPKRLLFVNETLKTVTFKETMPNKEAAEKVADVWATKIKSFFVGQFSFIVYIQRSEPYIKIS